MSTKPMASNSYKEVYMDPVLEEELFGGYNEAVKELFGSYEGLKAAISSSKSTSNAPQKRKRNREDGAKEGYLKHGLRDDIATEIGLRGDHFFSYDSDMEDEMSDGASSAGDPTAATDTTEKAQKAGDTGEQHLAPRTVVSKLNKVAADLAITDEDDEMTRMLKEALIETLHDEDDEPEDARIEAIFDKASLTTSERRTIATKFEEQVQAGKPAATLAMVQTATDMALATRRQKEMKQKAMQASHAPKKPSPLAKEVRAEGQEIEARPKLAAKSKKPAPGIAHSGGIVTAAAPVPLKLPMLGGNLAAQASARATTTAPAPTAASTPSSSASNTAYDAYTLNDMKKLCTERGLVKTGNKADILQRLKDYDEDVTAGRPPKGAKKAKKKEEKRVPLWKKLKEGAFKSSG